MAETLVVEHDDQQLMLTTLDNPYNPKTDYINWRIWDMENGYFTEAYLARLTDIPDSVDIDDDATINQLTNEAIRSILDHDVLGIYKLV